MRNIKLKYFFNSFAFPLPFPTDVYDNIIEKLAEENPSYTYKN